MGLVQYRRRQPLVNQRSQFLKRRNFFGPFLLSHCQFAFLWRMKVSIFCVSHFLLVDRVLCFFCRLYKREVCELFLFSFCVYPHSCVCVSLALSTEIGNLTKTGQYLSSFPSFSLHFASVQLLS